MPLVTPLRACLASLLVPLRQATVPQEFKAIFGVTDDVPESEEEYKTTQAPVQEWEDLTPEEREAAKDGLISVVGAPADVVATAKHLMQEKARKEQAASDDDFEGANPEESEDDEEENSSGRAQPPKAHSSTNKAPEALEASPMHALASTVRDAETEDSDADATDPVDAAPPAAADAAPATGSLRGSTASAATTPMPDWPMPDLVASAETTTSGQDSVASATATSTPAASEASTTTSAASEASTTTTPAASVTTASASAAPVTSASAAAVTTTKASAAAGSFDVNSIARLHTMLEAAEKADATPAASPPAHAFQTEEQDEEDEEEPSDADDDDYEASVRSVSRKNAGVAAIALRA